MPSTQSPNNYHRPHAELLMGQPLFRQGDNPVTTPFEPDNGPGVPLVATTTASVAVELPLGHGRQYIISNDGWVSFWYYFGGPDFLATVAYLEVPPGWTLSFTFPNDSSLTHVSVITRSGTTTGTLNFGRGE